jgi:hypothetical protein
MTRFDASFPRWKELPFEVPSRTRVAFFARLTFLPGGPSAARSASGISTTSPKPSTDRNRAPAHAYTVTLAISAAPQKILPQTGVWFTAET